MSIADEKNNESFASRWSRRKRGEPEPLDDSTVKEAEAPAIPLNTIITDGSTGRMQTTTEAERQAMEKRAETDEENPALTDEDMPDVNELTESSDYSGFLSPGVSEKLRKVALRKLFSGAGFNIRDGLDDYDEDFTNFEPLGDLITSDMKHRAELEAAKKKAEEEEQEKEREEAAEEEQVASQSDEEAPGEEEPGEEANEEENHNPTTA